VVTQPVFDLDLLERFLRRIEGLKIPLVAGIWPLISYRNAEFMVNIELRVAVPERYMERMRRGGDGGEGAPGGHRDRAGDGGAGAADGGGCAVERAVRPVRQWRSKWAEAIGER